ncbi:MAG TPA: flagellin [Phycisphaerales bacterium]|nr:flagellin [Phycisphaerales bacterium]
MTRINTNVPSLTAQRVLGENNLSLNVSLERLSTGLRINRGKDDPAGLIASQNLRAEKAAIGAAIANSERADQVVNIAEGGLQEISGLLNELQSLVTQTANEAGLSIEEKQANQLQIDSIIQTIDRVAGATSFQGLKLLNGNLDYVTTNVSGNIEAFKVNGAKLKHDDTLDVQVLVTGSAQVGGFYLSFGAANLNLGGSGPSDGISERFVIELAGSKGSRELSFASGTSIASIVDAINSFSEVTGVRAVASGAGGVSIQTVGFGSAEFVTVRVVDDGNINAGIAAAGVYKFQAANTAAASTVPADRTLFSSANNKTTDAGQDISATINGILATTEGTIARINTDFLDVEVDLKTGTGSGAEAQRLGAVNAFTINGGGADFQLAARVDIGGKVSIGVGDVAVRNLGRSRILEGSTYINYFLSDLGAGRGLNVVDGNRTGAQEVVAQAIKEVTSLRGRLGAFQKNTIGSTIRSLGISLENTTAAESLIRDSDFANETSGLTRSQVLVSSSTQILTIANTSPQAALQLLG